MENIRVFEEGGYIHFILRPEELMRLRYSEQSTIAFSAFMDGWLGQMKTQVRQNTMDGYRYAFEKHIRPFFDARGMTLATARPMDFQDFVNFKFEQGLSPTSIAKLHSIMHKCLKYAVALQIIPNNPADNVMLPKRRRFRGQVYDRAQLNVFLAAALQSPAEAAFVLAASYGLRRSECAGLRWSAIDFRARRMVINHTAILSNARTIFPASSGASAAAPVCRASGFTICGIRSRRSCSSRAFPSSRFRNGSVIRISPRPQTFTRTCRMWRRSLSPSARFRSSKSERCKIIPAFRSA